MSLKIQISNWQAITLIIIASVNSAVFFIPTDIVAITNQDAWIAVILAAFLNALFVYYPLAYLGMRYPKKTIIKYSEDIMGKFLGKIFGLLFIYYFFQNHCWSLREFGEVATILFPETPMIVYIIFLSLITIYAANNGLEVIGRCAEFIFPLGIIVFVFIGVSSFMNIKVSNILPVMENGIRPILRATLIPLDWLSLGVAFGMITPFVKNKTDLKKIGFTIIGIGGIILISFSLINIMVFGVPVLKITIYPLLSLARFVKLPAIERIEILITMVWIMGIFIKGALFSYVSVLSISQLLKLADYRFLIVPETILAIAYSIYQYDSFVEMSYLFSVASFYYLSFSLGLPFTLWIVSFVQVKLR